MVIMVGKDVPSGAQKLYDRYNRLLERYIDNQGRTVDRLHWGGDGSPLKEVTTYTGEPLDRANRETVFFNKDGDKYKRRVYKDNLLRLEQGFEGPDISRGIIVAKTYEEKYEYDGNEDRPSKVIRETFDHGKRTSLREEIKKRKQDDDLSNFDFMHEKDLNWR